MSFRNSLITQIHVAKNQLAMPDDGYRALLQRITGKESCSKMTVDELRRVLAEMKTKGFIVKSKNKRRMSPPSSGTGLDKIRAIWITMHKQGFVRDGSEAALDAYVKRMTSKINGTGVDSVAWLNETMAFTVLESLKRWHRRLMAEKLIEQGLTELYGHRKSWHTSTAPYAYVAAAYEGQQL